MKLDGGLLGYLESEGIIPTRQGRLNALIKDIVADGGYGLSYNRDDELIAKYDLEDMTEEEAEYVIREVDSRI